jgi:hypothetical protein
MLTVGGQLILGGYDPTSVAIYMCFYFLLRNPAALGQVRQEVRENFRMYADIEAETLRTLPFLNVCLQETLRLSAAATHHSLPRISPGAMVNQQYIPKGVSIPSVAPQQQFPQNQVLFDHKELISPLFRLSAETRFLHMVVALFSSTTLRASGWSGGYRKAIQATTRNSPPTITPPIILLSWVLDSSRDVKLRDICSV